MATHDVITDTILSEMGSPPIAGDTIYVSRGAMFDIDQDLACLLIRLGEESGGASPANERYGIVTQRPGTKITFDGAASITASGIYCNPASADASSKNNKVYIPGLSANVAEWDIATEWDTDVRFSCHMTYGYVDIENLHILANTSDKLGVNQFYLRPHTDFAPAGARFRLNRVHIPHIYGNGIHLAGTSSGNRNLPVDAKRCIMDGYMNGGHTFIYDAAFGLGSQGTVDFSDFMWDGPGGGYSKSVFVARTRKNMYIANNIASFADIRGQGKDGVTKISLLP